MQSSTVMALRTLVMLLSLLAVPLAAIFGTGSWPRVHELLDQLRTKVAAQLDPSRSGPAAPLESPAVASLAPVPLAGPPMMPAAPWAGTAPQVAIGPQGGASDAQAEPAPVEAASTPFAAPFTAAAVSPPPPSPFWPEAPSATAGEADPATQPAPFEADAVPLDTPAGAQVAAPDRAGWITHRLQTLGAAWYRLETAGAVGEMFRFQCKMTSPTNPNYVRYFEATSGEPLRAMQHVLDQVDAWMAARDTLRR